MPRRARLILPGFPHHVVQRGNRRQTVFLQDGDYAMFRTLLRRKCEEAGVACWAYCLMPNHIHLVLCPAEEASLARLMRDVQQIYTMRVNQREGWSGFLWQGRYHSCAMDEGHALAALRYVERNPVAAGLCAEPEDWPWSSSRHHTGLEVDPLVTTPEFLARIGNWRAYLRAAPDNAMITRIGHYTRSGAPLGAPGWVREIEARTGRSLGPPQRGRPKRHR